MLSLLNKIVIFIIAVIIATCTAQVSYEKCPAVYPMQNRNNSGILGVWYEIEHSSIVNYRQKRCVTLSYSLAENNSIKVDHRGLNVFNGGYRYFRNILHPYANDSNAVYRVELEPTARPNELIEIVLDTDYVNYEVKVICHIKGNDRDFVAVTNSRTTTVSPENAKHIYEVLQRNSIPTSPMESIDHQKCPDLWRFRLEDLGDP